MADNSTLPVSSGTEVFANDDIGSVKYPRVKATWGPDGTANDTDVATGKPMPVQLRGSDGTDRSNALPVTIATVPSHAVTNAGTFAVQSPTTTKVSANFNRPGNTTGYSANDAVNDNVTAGGGSSTELSWAITLNAGNIRRVRIKKSDQTVATPTLRLWLYDTVFASGAGDNEALVHPVTDSIGYVDVPVTSAGSDDAVGWASCDIPCTGATLYGQIQTLSAFTPANAETFTVTLWYLPG